MLTLSTRPMPFALLLLALTVYMGRAVPPSLLPEWPQAHAAAAPAQGQGQSPVVKTALRHEKTPAAGAQQRLGSP